MIQLATLSTRLAAGYKRNKIEVLKTLNYSIKFSKTKTPARVFLFAYFFAL